MSSQYGELRPIAAEILSLVWGTPANFNGFRVLVALLHGTLVVGVSQTSAFSRGRHLYSAGRPSRWAFAHISSLKLECGPMPNVMVALSNIGGALCSTPQSLARAHYTRGPSLNAVKTRNPLKFAGVPQTRQQISAASEPKFTIFQGRVGEILLSTIFFRLSIRALVAKIQPDKVVRWCPNGEFLTIFWVLHLQRAACSTFQTCTLNSH